MSELPLTGVYLGGKNGGETLAAIAREFYAPILPVVAELHGQGLSLRAIAAELDRRQIKTSFGQSRWSATGVKRALDRALREKLESMLVEAGRPPDP